MVQWDRNFPEVICFCPYGKLQTFICKGANYASTHAWPHPICIQSVSVA